MAKVSPSQYSVVSARLKLCEQCLPGLVRQSAIAVDLDTYLVDLHATDVQLTHQDVDAVSGHQISSIFEHRKVAARGVAGEPDEHFSAPAAISELQVHSHT